MTRTAKIFHCPGYPDELRIMANGCGLEYVHIDRTYYGREWCDRHDMVITETLEADNGEKFEIWRSSDLVCAIPVKGGRRK